MYKDPKKRDFRKVVCYDLKGQTKILSMTWVNDPTIIGRFVTNQFAFVEGHMYFNNKVFKVRYDTMIKENSDRLEQTDFFNKYENILDMKLGERVMAKMPKLSIAGHKTMYLVSNYLFKLPYKVILLPYLHERKLYLNEMKPENKYFFTSFTFN